MNGRKEGRDRKDGERDGGRKERREEEGKKGEERKEGRKVVIEMCNLIFAV